MEADEENTYEPSRTQGAFFALFGREADRGYETTGQSGIGDRAITLPAR